MKKVLSYTLSLFMILSILMFPSYEVQAANVSLGVSASTVKIGETVKVTVTVPDGTTATVDLKGWSSVLSFSSASVDVGTNGGTITINLGKMSMAGTNSVTVTFKANTSGTANIKATVVSAVDNNTVEDVALGGASTTITVANQTTNTEDSGSGTTETQKSADNSLSSLKLSSGTLSPSFKRNVTKYTATVGYDVTKVVVSAKTSNAKAVIESVTGDGTVNLKVGENTIKIVVKAENGVKATYTIVVTRKSQESTPPDPSESESTSESETTTPDVNEMLQWNGEQLQVPESIPAESIPTGFESTLLVVNGQQMDGLSFTKGDLKVLYLNNTNGAGSLYVYDEAQQTIYPFIKLTAEKSYVMVLLPDEANASAPEDFESCTFSIEGKGLVSAYQLKNEESETDDFYLVYCMNNTGEKGWYMYDSVEGTFQRYLALSPSVQTGGAVSDSTETDGDYAKLEKELKDAKMTQYIIAGIAAAIVLILIIVIVVLALKNRSREEDFFEECEDEEYEDYDEEEEVVEEVEEVEEVEDPTSILSSRKEDDDDLEFIDFE